METKPFKIMADTKLRVTRNYIKAYSIMLYATALGGLLFSIPSFGDSATTYLAVLWSCCATIWAVSTFFVVKKWKSRKVAQAVKITRLVCFISFVPAIMTTGEILGEMIF